MPSLAEISGTWVTFHELLDRLARAGLAPVFGEGVFECACRIEAVRSENRLGGSLWEALHDKWLSLPPSASWQDFVSGCCFAWHGDPPQKPGTCPHNFAGPPVHSRPELLGRAFYIYGGARLSQDGELTPLSEPDPRSSRDDVAMLDAEQLHRNGLSGDIVWVTWNRTDPAKCPFANRDCGGEIDAVLGLSSNPIQRRTYIRFRLPAQIALLIPLLTDAVVTGYNNVPGWHPYFLPAPRHAPHGHTRALPPYEHLGGCPEGIHRSLGTLSVGDLQIERVALPAR